MITAFPISESNSRPADRPWTEEENARYAAGRAETVRLANERAKAKRDGTWTLIGGGWTATFVVHGDTVVLTHTRGRGAFSRSEQPVTMTRAEAREQWSRLIDAGYTLF